MAKKIEPRLLTVFQLGKLQEVESSIDCECPKHMAALILSLRAFEDYSSDCENQTEKDAEIHAMLHQETARARAIMENALIKLCEHENLDLGAPIQ